MNEIKIDGTIVSETETRTRPDGIETAATSLCFAKKNGTVWLFCIADRAYKLATFKPGDLVTVRGRLTVNELNGKACILVDEIHHLRAREESTADREAELWNASRRHQHNARVKGDNRWATRAGYVK